MKFNEMKIKDVLDNPKLMEVVEKFIPDWKKFPVGLLKNKKVADVIKLAKDKGLCTDADVEQLTAKIEEVLGK